MVLPSAKPPPSPSKHDPSCPSPLSRSPDQPRGHRVNVLVIGRAPNAARPASAMGILRRCGQETREGCEPARRSAGNRPASTTTPPGCRGRHSVCDRADAVVEVEVVVAPGLQPAQRFLRGERRSGPSIDDRTSTDDRTLRAVSPRRNGGTDPVPGTQPLVAASSRRTRGPGGATRRALRVQLDLGQGRGLPHRKCNPRFGEQSRAVSEEIVLIRVRNTHVDNPRGSERRPGWSPL
jgi:hypothetical protein